jgi:hypothetical protein
MVPVLLYPSPGMLLLADRGFWSHALWKASADGFTARRSWSSHPTLTSAFAIRGPIPGCRRPPCVRALRARGRCGARTGTDGGGGNGMLTVRRSDMPTVLPRA